MLHKPFLTSSLLNGSLIFNKAYLGRHLGRVITSFTRSREGLVPEYLSESLAPVFRGLQSVRRLRMGFRLGGRPLLRVLFHSTSGLRPICFTVSHNVNHAKVSRARPEYGKTTLTPLQEYSKTQEHGHLRCLAERVEKPASKVV